MKPTAAGRTAKSAPRLDAFAVALRARAREKGRRTRLTAEEVEAVATRVALLDMAAEEVGAYAPRPSRGESSLTAEEWRVFQEGAGGRLKPLRPGPEHPHTRYLAELARLRADSMSVEEAAKLLGVNTSRVRQRLGGRTRTLPGMKVGRSWRVFRYQFDGDRLPPGLERVIAAMPRNREPVGDHRWLTLPDPELALDDGGDDCVSPLTWLRMGRDPEPVVTTASHLDRGM